jgi:diguanylate cyclase (GGDEF)-like protein
MLKPDKPENETQRLETLKSLGRLKTTPDERFDRLTRLASHVFDVPVAMVSLVDENIQWFKSCHGLDVTHTSRDVSFCGHAILGDDAFVIEDATTDSRFADNPLVTGEPHIRFYAGFPLRYLNGTKLGTLCLIDHQPRQLEKRERQILKDIASIAESELQALELATADELTGINNRRGFFVTAGQALSLCQRQNLPVSLVFLDLNEFKPINDRFGHAEGDKALRLFADTLVNVCRKNDIAARMGGDEFVLLLTNVKPDEVEQVLSRFAALIEEANAAQVLGYAVTFSYGTVHFDEDRHGGLEGLLAEGDELMYQRKQRSKQDKYKG